MTNWIRRRWWLLALLFCLGSFAVYYSSFSSVRQAGSRAHGTKTLPSEAPPTPTQSLPVPAGTDSPPPPPPPRPAAIRGHKAEAKPAPDDDAILLENALKRLRPGDLAYSTPERMRTGKSEIVTARIGAHGVDITTGLPADQNKQTVATPISTKMKMTLKGPDFQIDALDSEEQYVDGLHPTEWKWQIAPKKPGKLHLRLAAIVELHDLSKDLTTLDRDIAVEVDRVGAVEAFVAQNWQWLLSGSGGLGLVAGAWALLRRKKKPDDAKSWEKP